MDGRPMLGTRLRSTIVVFLAAAKVLANGCEALPGLAPPVTTVRLMNNGDFAVEGELLYDDEDFTIVELPEPFGERRPIVLPAGGQSAFSVPCDEFQAVIIADADLQWIAGVGPSAGTDVLRQGDDFDCGDVLRFTFDHSAAIVDFDVRIDVIRSDAEP
jgi:hypothetical protein